MLTRIKNFFLHPTRLRFVHLGRKLLLLLAVLLAVFVLVFKVARYYPADRGLEARPGSFGVTFSTKFSDELNLDWKEVYGAILEELQVKLIRIPVYWDEIEATEGVYDFSRYDYLLREGAKHDAKFILTVGRRVPRWPECHSPAWLNKKSDTEAKALTLKTIQMIVERYRGETSLEYWQVENEPFLGTFGVCPPLDEEFLRQEFNLVRSLDDRPVIITGSGEMSWWRNEAAIGDIFGSTLYRVVYDYRLGYLHHPWPALFYRLKAKLSGLAPERLMIMELQAEPWVPQGRMIYLTTDDINKTMSLRQFRANLQYAINLDFSRTYTWGVEWWYFQKKYGNPEYWRIAEGLFK